MASSIFGMTMEHDSIDTSGLKLSQTTSSTSMGEEFVCSSNTSSSILDSLLPKVTFNHIDSITDADMELMTPILEPGSMLDVGTADNNVLYCIDPYPVEPPCYDLANPSKVIRYPIYEHCRPCLASVKPPSYTPSVDYYTVVSMKMEKLSPFENSTSKLWNNFILQINSTQINFYFVDDALTKHIKNYYGGSMIDHSHHSKDANEHHHSARSLFSAFTTKSTYQFDKYDKAGICRAIARDESRFLSDEYLHKSYSLQCAKVGLPIDYSSRDFVLRMRCEGQQFLVQFSHVDELINWAMYLNMGISLSLDLELRELPTYRSVPRRRTRRPRPHKNKNQNKNKNKNKNKDKGKEQSRNNGSRNDLYSHVLTLRRSNTSSVVTKTTAVNERPKNKSRSRSLTLLPPSVSAVGHNVSEASNSSSSTRRNSQGDICGLLTSKLRNFFKTDSSSRKNSVVTFEQIRGSNELNSVQEEINDNGSATNTNTSVVSPTFSSAAHSPLMSQSSISEDYRSRSGSNPLDPLHCDLSMLKIGGPDLPCNGTRRPSVFNSTDRTIREEEFSEDEEDEDDYEEEDDGEDDDINRLIFLDEGRFHYENTDANEYEAMFNTRNIFINSNHGSSRSGSSDKGHKKHFNDDLKWAPTAHLVSRKRYIKDSLRCIKPLTEDHPWTGKIIFKPTPPPSFETNNLPIKIHGDENSTDLKTIKNHYLKPYIVGSCGFLKTGSKKFQPYKKINEVTN